MRTTRHPTWAGMLAGAAFSACSAFSPALAQTSAAPPAEASPSSYCSSSVAPYRGSEFLAYIRTSPVVDSVSENGLKVLATRLSEKTSLEESSQNKKVDVTGVDIETQDICHFHFIYWPVEADPRPLSAPAQRKVEEYLRRGGFILFDVRDVNASWDESLKTLLGSVNLGLLKPAADVPSVCETFYKNVQSYPGSFNVGSVYAQVPLRKTGDLVSQVMVGQRRWADAWAALTYSPGSRGHEQSLRAGVNLVLYAFTGGYKCDQADRTLEKIGGGSPRP